MDKKTSLLLIITACLSFLLGQTISSKADGKSFAGVVPFVTPAGLVGLFNQNDGKIYMYDTDIKECLFEGQVNELGKPTTKIHSQDKIHNLNAVPIISK